MSNTVKKGKRDRAYIRRKLEQSSNMIDKVMERLGEARQPFDEMDYDKQVEQIDEIAKVLVIVQDAIKEFRGCM